MSAVAARRKSLVRLLPLLLIPLLLPFGRLAELGTLAALLALPWIVRQEQGAWLRLPSLRLFAVLFACFVGAALLSLPDAADPARSLGTFAGLWRYLALGLFACWALRPALRMEAVQGLTALVVAIWALDAWLQILTGWSLGGPAADTRLTGIFGAGNLKLGIALATLSPFLLAWLRRRLGWRGLVLGFFLLLAPIILAGARQAWLQFALVMLACIWQIEVRPLRRVGLFAAVALAGVLAVGAAWWQSPGFAQRMERSMHALRGDVHGLDWALSGRLHIWGVALRMVADHPLNGVGVRGFRSAYTAYAGADDPFIAGESCAPGQGACHPHQWLLEVAAECGIPGLLLWLVGIGIALRTWWRAAPAARKRAWPVSVALATVLFPLNTHLAFYSAWWGLLFWWLLALWCALIAAPAEPDEVPDARA